MASLVLPRLRAHHLGEGLESARLGVSRDCIGLDHCSDAQRRFRAVLALGLLNHDRQPAPPGEWWLAHLTNYGLKVLPRHDELVIWSHAPVNVTEILLHDLPGLRFVALSDKLDYFRLVWKPSGARLTVTERHTSDGVTFGRNRRLDSHRKDWGTRHGVDVALREREIAALAEIPDMTPAARILLAGLTARSTLRDDTEQWAVGGWMNDPYQRQPRLHTGGTPTRRLWGHGDRWELDWEYHPRPADLLQALTHPVTGVKGIQTDLTARHPTVRLDGATLRLRHHDHSL